MPLKKLRERRAGLCGTKQQLYFRECYLLDCWHLLLHPSLLLVLQLLPLAIQILIEGPSLHLRNNMADHN